MKRFPILAGALAIAMTVPATAADDIKTTVTFKKWTVDSTGSNGSQTLPKNATYTHCASHTVLSIHTLGPYAKAKKGTKFSEIWKRNGKVFKTYKNLTWTKKSGEYDAYIDAGFKGVKDGKYVSIIKQSGKRLGVSGTLTVKTTPNC